MKMLLSLAFLGSLLFGSDLKINYDLDIASAKAKSENKTLIFYVYSTNCPWCKKMDKETYKNKDVIKELNSNYIFVKLNKDKDDIPEHLIPRFVPTTYILDSNQEEIFAMYGYKDSNEFLRVLEDLKSDF
ncbi:thioredoxin family protein [Arcobacter sp. FWKO B]|uniref:thioredoxin family protein n=1 Tax=Arcobacter sp. FWKO B TaxID=2593672 RepID=UPI0018A38695|nr:thioredoxin family protein [Arcobacter sp. FWKO B]QOG11649.1 thioredoxin family protein [Arcobacter sp. FWKO B]